MNDIQAIKEVLKEPRQILITTHSHPDADALGSSLGLMHYLQNNGHSVSVITPTDYPEFLKWMPGNDSVVVFDQDKHEPVKNLLENSDLIFCLDFSDLKRIDKLGELVADSPAKKITIDHHHNPQDFSEWMIHSTKAAATAELVFDMICEIDGAEGVTQEIAECLYAGLMTDTGSFQHSNVNAKVLHTAGELVNRGASANKIAQLIYDNNSLNRLKFMGYALWELLEVDMKNRTAFFTISAQDAKKFNLQAGDTEGLVNYALSVKGIKVAALFKEQDGIVKISFRSVDDIAVNTFAANYFDGGGHTNAAGGRSDESLVDTVKKFRKLIKSGKLLEK